jgi:hypothetical protein
MVEDKDPLETTNARTRPFGPVAAVFIAAGIAAVVMGIVTTVSEASKSFADAIQWNAGVGPLSGKTIITTVVFLVAWAILHLFWRDRDPVPSKVFLWTWVMLAIGVVMTFPIFFQLFESS